MAWSKRTIAATLWERKLTFFSVFLAVFFLSLSFLALLGVVPEGFFGESNDTDSVVSEPRTETPQPVVLSEEPLRIVIESVGVESAISNPDSRDVTILDAALKEGVVRYPGTGRPGEERTMFLFGHSSYLPLVHNSAYKAFNNIQKLATGDIIKVRGAYREYLYRVSSVRKADAAEAFVDLSAVTGKLILSTCDSFGKQSDRFVVESEYIGSYEL